MKTASCFYATLLLVFVCGTHPASAQEHVLVTPQEAHWRPSKLLPAGAEVAVLTGDPSQRGAYAVRLRFPAHFAVPPHWHPADEHVIVISGALTFGTGDRLDRDAQSNKTLPPGGFALMPARMHHYAFTGEQATTVVMYGEGPLQINYIDKQ